MILLNLRFIQDFLNSVTTNLQMVKTAYMLVLFEFLNIKA